MSRPPLSDVPIARAQRERGSALIVALILIVVLTVIGFGLLTRSLMVQRIAGSERWSTKAFYAADSGIDVAVARLRISRHAGFQMQLEDLRGATGGEDRGEVEITVSDFSDVGIPQPADGYQTGSVQGGTEGLFTQAYRGTSIARQALTRSERRIEATMTIEAKPLGSIPQ